MEQIHDRVAGLDVHRDTVAVCVRTPGPRGGVQTEKARFDTTAGGLAAGAPPVRTQPGRAMTEARIAGQRDPAALAGLAKGKLRPKIPQLTAALRGHFGAHHAIVAARILAHLDFLDETIGALDAQIAARVAERYQSAARLLADVPGLERRSVEVIIAETG